MALSINVYRKMTLNALQLRLKNPTSADDAVAIQSVIDERSQTATTTDKVEKPVIIL